MLLTRMILVCATAAIATAGLAGCGGERSASTGHTSVVAASYPLAYVAEQIGGARLQVENLTPAGAEPHDHELTPSDVEKVRAADLVLYLGGGFQPALEAAVADRTGPSLDVLAGQALESGEQVDVHAWLDPARYVAIARRVAAELGDSGLADSLVGRLRRLDREFATGLRRCARRELITSHAAFGQLAKRYGLRQIPLTGGSPEIEPGARDVAELVARVRAADATTVFVEPLVSPLLAKTVAREAGVATAPLDPLESLTPSQLEAGDDYFSVMRANLVTLREALGCT